jgi:hypothetical protein
MTQQIPNPAAHLTRGHLPARNVIWNLIGNGAPMIVAVGRWRSSWLRNCEVAKMKGMGLVNINTPLPPMFL